ncbi:unnamed protein product, partial [Meganyctiphanes norvegica]
MVQDTFHQDWYCTCKIEVDVIDVNDNPPVFTQPLYSVNLPENSPEDILLIKVKASDPDKGKNKKVVYSIEGNSIFTIDSDSGIVSATQSLDRESQAMYNITVLATDRGTPPLASQAQILLLVT